MGEYQMMHGELANQVKATIGFKCVGLLVNYRDTKLTDKVLNTLLGSKLKRAEIDENVRGIMEYIYRQTEYNVDLIINNKEYTTEMKTFLENFPFNRIVLIDKVSQITQRLITGDLTLYIDNDDYQRSLINSPYAISLHELSRYMKCGKR